MPSINPIKWSLAHIEKLKAKGSIRDYKVGKQEPGEKKKSKYNNKTRVWRGEKFDSDKEYLRYRDLLLLLKAGKIGQLKRQVPYELNEGGTHSYKYIADFVYVDVETGQTIVEDTKGFRTREYLKKRRLIKKIHGIIILET